MLPSARRQDHARRAGMREPAGSWDVAREQVKVKRAKSTKPPKASRAEPAKASCEEPPTAGLTATSPHDVATPALASRRSRQVHGVFGGAFLGAVLIHVAAMSLLAWSWRVPSPAASSPLEP